MKNLPLTVIRLTVFAATLVCASHAFAQTTRAPKRPESGEARSMRVFALRLKPGQDLRQEIEAFAKAKHFHAGFIITTVGSLKHAAIRLADQSSETQFEGKFEIVSLVGTLSPDGVHLHLSISDSSGKTIGGHLAEGCLIYTTAEIVMGDAPGLIFSRERDAETGYQELRIRKTRP